MKRNEFTIRFVIPIITGVLGLLSQPLLSTLLAPYIDDPTKITLAILFLLSFILIISLITASIVFRQVIQFEQRTTDLMERIAQRSGLVVEFIQGFPDPKPGYSLTKQLLSQCRELLVLDYQSITPEKMQYYYEVTPGEDKLRLEYYDFLFQRIKKGMHYKRIIQVIDGPCETISKKNLRDNTLVAHCEEVFRLKRANPNLQAHVKCSGLYLPEVSMQIYDRRYLVWELAIQDPAADGTILSFLVGSLVFDDPHGLIVNRFVELFDKIDNSAEPLKVFVD